MASLESFVPAGGTVSRVAAQQVIQISGALLQVTGRLTAGTVPPGWRIDCYSGGGLAFNVPDAAARDISISSRSGASLTLSAADWGALLDGDALEKDGDLGDLDNGTVYYAERGASPVIHLHATLADALAGASGTRISAGTGAVPGGDGGLALAAGVRSIGQIGDADGPEVHILERADAHAFRGDNYNSATEICRFQAGGITLENFYWECLRPDASPDASRNDFDIAPGAAPVFRRGEIATLAQYNHFASSGIVIDDLRFRNRTVAAGNWAMEFTAAFTTSPRQLGILPANRAVSVLGIFLTDGVPLKLFGLSGLAQQASQGFGGIELGIFNPSGSNHLTNSQADAKVIWMVDPAGSPGKRSPRGIIEIRRSVTLDFGAEASGAGGSCRLIPMDSNPPYSADVVDDAEQGPHVFPEVLHKRSAGGSLAYSTFAQYRYLKVSPSYRKASGTFTVAEQAQAGLTQRITATLTREVWPDGSAYAHAAPSSADSVDALYSAIKAHELANPKDGGASASLAVISASGYIQLGDGVNLVLSSSATDLTAWDAGTTTLTVKASATVAASGKGVLGVETTGTGTVSVTGTVDITAFLTKQGTNQNSILAVSAAEASVKLALFAADGTALGTFTTTSDDMDTTFAATAAQSTAGAKLVASRVGHEPQVRTLDLAAGGSFTESFGAMREIAQFDGSASYAASRVSSASTVSWAVGNVASVSAKLDVANERLSALEAFSTFASKAHGTASGMKYLAFGGQLPVALSSFTGDQLSLPSMVQIRRRASGNVNAAISASVIGEPGATLTDESNGAVQFIGGVDISTFQKAFFTDFDLDPDVTGTQSLAAKLLTLGTVAQSNATAIAALPSAVTIRDAITPSIPSSSATAQAVMAYTVTGSRSAAKVLEILDAVSAGTVTITGSVAAFHDPAGGEVIRGTVDGNGGRTDIVVAP